MLKNRVLSLFSFLWLILCISFVFAIHSVFLSGSNSYEFWYSVALLSGKTALIFFAITLSPGIFKRFSIRHKILALIMIFRRQFGITMFLFAAFHAFIIGILPKISTGHPFKYATFELFGLSALILLFFLFVTSNNFSQHLLGKWWYMLHRLVYVIMWLILFHTALQRISFWTILASVLVISEMSGIIYSKFRQKTSQLK